MKAVAAARNPKPRLPKIGIVERFRRGDYEHVERVIDDLRALGVQDLRVGISWAEWYASEGDGWYAWLLPKLAREVRILPCVAYTPPSLGLVPKFSSPPAVPKLYADFLDVMITRFGALFEWIELWNQPDNPHEWDSRLDPDWRIFCEMVGGAAYWIHKRGRKTVLPGPSATNVEWLNLMHERGVLAYVDAIGVQGFPNTAEVPWRGWLQEIGDLHDRLVALKIDPEIWITQTGFSTWRGDERAQVRAFLDALAAPADRVYWWRTHDHHPQHIDSFHSDQREYHYGLKRSDGHPKLLFEIWADGGVRAVQESEHTHLSIRTGGRRKYTLITGGAGFIGTNLARRLLTADQNVMIYDDLSREGSERNLAELHETFPKGLRLEIADIRDAQTLSSAVRSAEQVFHLAAQVAVTSSLTDPRHDFEVNVGGTLTLLETLRSMDHPPPLLFTSTNKVYGGLQTIALEAHGQRYQPLETTLRKGINETCPLDFHSPYGCSKGAADQYVLDYARTFDLPAIVFRMSCIYGLHQNGTEDQGWVAHFLLTALAKRPLILYGDGKQVRDLLYIDDLVDAFLLAQANSQSLAGQAFNIGGGLGNTASLLEVLDLIGSLLGEKPNGEMRGWRPGDQRYYVSDIAKFRSATGWAPKVSVREGIERLCMWLLESQGLPVPAHLEPDESIHAVLTR
jgi:CDP-paratose 2-epimerase